MSENKYELKRSMNGRDPKISLKEGLEGSLLQVLISGRGDVVYGPREGLKFYGRGPCTLEARYGFAASRIKDLNSRQVRVIAEMMDIPVREFEMAVDIEREIDIDQELSDASLIGAVDHALRKIGV